MRRDTPGVRRRLPETAGARRREGQERSEVSRPRRGRQKQRRHREDAGGQAILVIDMSGQGAGVGNVASATGLTRQTVYRIRDDALGAEAAITEWGL